jgi:hypothetical protein
MPLARVLKSLLSAVARSVQQNPSWDVFDKDTCRRSTSRGALLASDHVHAWMPRLPSRSKRRPRGNREQVRLHGHGAGAVCKPYAVRLDWKLWKSLRLARCIATVQPDRSRLTIRESDLLGHLRIRFKCYQVKQPFLLYGLRQGKPRAQPKTACCAKWERWARCRRLSGGPRPAWGEPQRGRGREAGGNRSQAGT